MKRANGRIRASEAGLVKTQIVKVPPFKDLMWPVLQFIRGSPDAAVAAEDIESHFRKLGYPWENQGASGLNSQLSWAFSYLRLTGCAVSVANRTLQVTEVGKKVSHEELESLRLAAGRAARVRSIEKRKTKAQLKAPSEETPLSVKGSIGSLIAFGRAGVLSANAVFDGIEKVLDLSPAGEAKT